MHDILCRYVIDFSSAHSATFITRSHSPCDTRPSRHYYYKSIFLHVDPKTLFGLNSLVCVVIGLALVLFALVFYVIIILLQLKVKPAN